MPNAAAAPVAGHQVLAFTARPHIPSGPAMGPLPRLAWGTGTGQLSVTITVTRIYGLGRAGQQEARGKICLQFGQHKQ